MKNAHSSGMDKMKLSELEDYWNMNHQRIEDELKKGIYQPGIIYNYEIINPRGKKRVISSLNVIDRFVARLLAQKLRRYIEPEFCEYSYAYQENKGILAAVSRARECIDAGNIFVAEIDIQNYFDVISLERMMQLLVQRIDDEYVLELLRSFLYCKVSEDNYIKDKTRGLVQGNACSPVLSNLYLHDFDLYLESKDYLWVRFADNINIYTKTQEEAVNVYHEICKVLEEQFKTPVNEKKSGVFRACDRRFLGYEFYKTHGRTELRKYQYKKMNTYFNWHQSVVRKVNREYHITGNGVLTKRDYALLFENEEEKHHIPVEAMEQMNIYGDVTIHPAVLKTISYKKIRLAFVDQYGNVLGYFVPEGYRAASNVFLRQCQFYSEISLRLNLARQMEIAAIHNMRAILRYYKKADEGLTEAIQALSGFITEVNEGKTIDSLMLSEARARQVYYKSFNIILKNKDFHYEKRTKRPPKDPLNALISFGNTLLYNQFLQIIWRTSLDPKIGVVHAANRRNYSLNLDFADVFKPIIVDRTIFSLINRGQLKVDEHFQKVDNGGVYLNRDGKKTLIEAFEGKMAAQLVIEGKRQTYRHLMIHEVKNFLALIADGAEYRPYKYY